MTACFCLPDRVRAHAYHFHDVSIRSIESCNLTGRAEAYSPNFIRTRKCGDQYPQMRCHPPHKSLDLLSIRPGTLVLQLDT
jgi:hypothetical protein